MFLAKLALSVLIIVTLIMDVIRQVIINQFVIIVIGHFQSQLKVGLQTLLRINAHVAQVDILMLVQRNVSNVQQNVRSVRKILVQFVRNVTTPHYNFLHVILAILELISPRLRNVIKLVMLIVILVVEVLKMTVYHVNQVHSEFLITTNVFARKGTTQILKEMTLRRDAQPVIGAVKIAIQDHLVLLVLEIKQSRLKGQEKDSVSALRIMFRQQI